MNKWLSPAWKNEQAVGPHLTSLNTNKKAVRITPDRLFVFLSTLSARRHIVDIVESEPIIQALHSLFCRL